MAERLCVAVIGNRNSGKSQTWKLLFAAWPRGEVLNFERGRNATVASGLYFYRMEAVSVENPNKRFMDVKKMILLK